MPLAPLSIQEKALLDRYAKEKQLLAREQADLLQQLASINEELKDAKRQHGALHNSRIATISFLPNEILSVIFEILHESQVLDSGLPSLEGSTNRQSEIRVGKAKGGSGDYGVYGRVEIVLSRVCSRWRTVAVGLASLWSVFWCDRPGSCDRLISETKRLRTYLRRSGDFDLKLYFDFTCAGDEWSSSSSSPQADAVGVSTRRFEGLMLRLLGMAAVHSDRWKHLTVVANDSRQRAVSAKFGEDIARLSVVRLERLVICTGPAIGARGRLDEGRGWSPNVMQGSTPIREGEGEGGEVDSLSCPSLKYLKLDSSGLTFCRPGIRNLAHLILEVGDTSSSSAFEIDWPVLLSSDLLRSPILETISLCDDLLRKSTFPSSGYDPEEYYLELTSLRHLRLGTTSAKNDRHSFFFFMLRYVTAPKLQSLSIAGYSIDESPWGMEPEEWRALQEQNVDGTPVRSGGPRAVFPSLTSISLVEVTLSSSPISCAAFLRLAWVTSTAQTVVLSSHDAVEKRSLAQVLQKWAPWNESQIPLSSLWPSATDIMVNFTITEPNMHRCYREFAWWCIYMPRKWKMLRVLRVPPLWVHVWLSRIKQPVRMNDGYPMNFTWAERKEGEDEASRFGGYTIWVDRKPLRIEPIGEVIPRFWPPGSNFDTPFNSVVSECFEPFKTDIARTNTPETATEQDV